MLSCISQAWMCANYVILSLDADSIPTYFVYDYNQILMICDTLSEGLFNVV
jgi:hypothetical protein